MGLGRLFKDNAGLLGGIIGQTLIPIPGVGAAIGSSLGSLAGGASVGEAVAGGAISAATGGLGGGAAGAAGDVAKRGFFQKAGDFLGSNAGAAALEIGGGLIASKAMGKGPQLNDFMPNRSLETEVGAIQREQFRRTAAALSLGGERAIESARAAGMSGSALGAGLSGMFRQQGDSLLGLLAQESDQRMRATNADIARDDNIGMQNFNIANQRFAGKGENIGNIFSGIRDTVQANQQRDLLSGIFSNRGTVPSSENVGAEVNTGNDLFSIQDMFAIKELMDT